MRLQQYYKMWSQLYESNIEKNIDEVLDLNTKVKRISHMEWYFWVKNDLYVVKIGKRGKSHYELSFIHKDIESKEETSNLTNKHTPFSVMDGVAVVMKELIEERRPQTIEFSVFGEDKKIKMFKKIMNLILKKYKDIFGDYKVKEGIAKLPLDYGLPKELLQVTGIKFLMKRDN